MSAASMIATHMNAPYGHIVSESDVAASLVSGKLSASTKNANDILAALFTEVDPTLILACAAQVKASGDAVQKLYQQTLSLGVMKNPVWEKAAANALA